MDSKQTYCVGSLPKYNTLDKKENEKGKSKTQKVVKYGKGKYDIRGHSKSQFLTK